MTFAIIACLLAPLVTAAAQPAAKPGSGEGEGTLEIVGKGVEKLVLLPIEHRDLDVGRGADIAFVGKHPTRELIRPSPSVVLPAGEYWVQELVLQAGFERRQLGPGASPRSMHRFAIVPGQACRLEIGTPLTSTVTSQRRGSVLKLDYALTGADGWKYSSRDRSDPPRFTVLQGGREIGSGSFKYG